MKYNFNTILKLCSRYYLQKKMYLSNDKNGTKLAKSVDKTFNFRLSRLIYLFIC